MFDRNCIAAFLQRIFHPIENIFAKTRISGLLRQTALALISLIVSGSGSVSAEDFSLVSPVFDLPASRLPPASANASSSPSGGFLYSDSVIANGFDSDRSHVTFGSFHVSSSNSNTMMTNFRRLADHAQEELSNLPVREWATE